MQLFVYKTYSISDNRFPVSGYRTSRGIKSNNI